MASAKPSQPPKADMSVLVTRVDALSQKAGLGSLPIGATKLPLWKRWVEGAGPEYDVTGLRDIVLANAVLLDDVKGDLDTLRGSTDHRLDIVEAKVAALEAAPPSPFPG